MNERKHMNVYQLAAIVIFIVLVLFSYFIAESDDAPGVIIIGTTLAALFCLLLCGVGTIIDILKENNKLIEKAYAKKI